MILHSRSSRSRPFSFGATPAASLAAMPAATPAASLAATFAFASPLLVALPALLAFLAFLAFLALPVLPASARAADIPPLVLGSAWYPEQWPESVWEKDLALMQAAGMNMVRIGEFAWSSMEPEEGRYTFDWLEKAVAAAARHGMVVVLGTPTDAPPAWLT
ncbi:MAG: beta-galactosidase, partial [Opitutaceae bacterium]|nr:beta-galactosidase [Opitutaceae bacterium]